MLRKDPTDELGRSVCRLYPGWEMGLGGGGAGGSQTAEDEIIETISEVRSGAGGERFWQEDWKALITVLRWKTLDPDEHPKKVAYAEKNLSSMEFEFGRNHAVDSTMPRFALFDGVGGACMLPDGQFDVTIFENFKEHRKLIGLISRAEGIARRANELWDPTSMSEGPLNRPFAWLFRDQGSRCLEARLPHSKESFEIFTQILAAISADDGTAGTVEAIRGRLREATAEFNVAAKRESQLRYSQGLLVGAVVALVVCGVAGAFVAIFDLKAYYWIAAPLGALGALFSVLRRIDRGKLKLDWRSTKDLLLGLGFFRPFLGAIAGMVAVAAIEAGLVTGVLADDVPKLALFAAFGFAAGFSERLLPDMLASTSPKEEEPKAEEPDPPAAT